MKIILHIALIALTLFFVPQYTIWWYIGPIAALVGFLIPYGKTFSSFLISFLISFIVWGISTVILASQNEMILADRVGNIFGVSGFGLVLITGLFAGLLTGLASASGHSLRHLFNQ